jgi:TM2 domain-containing membrane protein YozV
MPTGLQGPSFDASDRPSPNLGSPDPYPKQAQYFSAQDDPPAQNVAPNWPQQQPQQVVYVQQPSPPAQPPKQRSTAMLLEIGLGLIGLLGFGWIYAGKTGTGIAILLINLGVNIFFVLLGALTFGLSIIIALPVQITAIIISAVTLNNHTKKRTDLFGP